MSEITTREEIETTPSTVTLSPTTDLLPWQAQPGEPSLWYNRFAHYYLNQPGAKRNLSRAYQDYRIEQDNDLERQSIVTCGTWYDAYSQYRWHDRALMYDQHLINTWLEQNSQSMLIHKARKLNLWTEIVERHSAELASRDVRGMSENQLTRTIKTINHEISAELPQQPQLSLHIHAIHPDLQKLIRDAIESRE